MTPKEKLVAAVLAQRKKGGAAPADDGATLPVAPKSKKKPAKKSKMPFYQKAKMRGVEK